jgi:glucose/mannose transport system substrate-binding protein
MLALALAYGAPAGAEPTPRPVPPNRVLFYSWWAARSANGALRALADQMESQYPGVHVDSHLVPGDWGARNLFPIIKDLVDAGRAPEAFQMHAGYAAQSFFDAGLLEPIDAIWSSEGLTTTTPPLIQDLCRIDGHYHSVPIGIHRLNLIWCNKAVLDAHDVDPTSITTWDDFFKACARLRSQGVEPPIQVGESWTIGLVFQGIMASQGTAAYQDWINGKLTQTDDPRLVRAFEILGRYMAYANSDNARLGWVPLFKKLILGQSAFVVMGDWVNGEFRQARKTYGSDYVAIPVPGTASMYGVTIDTLLHPRSVLDPVNAERWLRLGASRRGQDAFNVVKGSIPARNDPDVALYDAYQRVAIAQIKHAELIYPSIAEATPYMFETELLGILGRFATDRDAKKGARDLALVTRRLAPSFTRTVVLRKSSPVPPSR